MIRSPVASPVLALPRPAILPSYGAADQLLQRMTVTPDATRRFLYADRFNAGARLSFWAKLDAIWAHAAHTEQAGRLNWLNASFTCVTVNSPTFTTDRGFTPDGSTSYLNTQFNPSSAGGKFTQNSGSFGIRSNTNNAAAGSLAGFYDGAKGITINPRTVANAFQVRCNQAAMDSATPSPSTSLGMFCVSRTGSGAVKGYKNGVAEITGTTASTTIADGALRLGSISDSSYRACQFSMAFVGSGMTDQEMLDLYNWFEVWRVAVGVT